MLIKRKWRGLQHRRWHPQQHRMHFLHLACSTMSKWRWSMRFRSSILAANSETWNGVFRSWNSHMNQWICRQSNGPIRGMWRDQPHKSSFFMSPMISELCGRCWFYYARVIYICAYNYSNLEVFVLLLLSFQFVTVFDDSSGIFSVTYFPFVTQDPCLNRCSVRCKSLSLQQINLHS